MATARDGARELAAFARNSTVKDVLEWKKKLRTECELEKKEVIVIEVHNTVGKALGMLAEANVLSAPVVVQDQRNAKENAIVMQEPVTLVGFLGVTDVLKVFLDEFVRDAFENNRDLIAEDADVRERIEELDRLGEKFERKTVSSICNAVCAGAFSSPQRYDGGVIYTKDLCMSLMTAIQEGFFNVRDKIPAHRLLVLEPGDDLFVQHSRSPTTTMFARGRVVDILSQSDVVGYLCEKLETLPSLRQCRVSDLEVGTSWSDMVFVTSEMPAIDVLSMMSSKGLTSLAIVAHDSVESPRAVERGRLEGNLSTSDFRGLQPHEFRQLALPVKEFLAARSKLRTQMKARQRKNLVSVPEQATVQQVLEMLAKHRIHRVYTVNEYGRAMGVITLTDVLLLINSLAC